MLQLLASINPIVSSLPRAQCENVLVIGAADCGAAAEVAADLSSAGLDGVLCLELSCSSTNVRKT